METLQETLKLKETYKLNEFAYAAIYKDPRTGQLYYRVLEPSLTEEERRQLEHLKDLIFQEIDINLKDIKNDSDAVKYLREQLIKIIRKYGLRVRKSSFEKYIYMLSKDLIHLGKITPLMQDPYIEDISCNGPNMPVYVWHKLYESLPVVNISFGEKELDDFVVRLAYKAGRHVSLAQPILDASLPDGSRLNVTYSSEITKKGSTFTIRKFRSDPYTIVDLIKLGSLSFEMAAYFWTLIENKLSVMIAGGTATGKTTFLNVLSLFIRPALKIVTIEDTAEINLPHENWIQCVARPKLTGSEVSEISLFDLLKNAMRQRPDYIIVGEVRGAEAYSLFQAIATGHGGLSTVHAESIPDMFYRLESEPMNIPRVLHTLIDVACLAVRARYEDKVVRRLQTVTEIVGFDSRTREIMVNEVFKWDMNRDAYNRVGRSYVLEKIQRQLGLTLREMREMLEQKRVILEWLVRKNIRFYRDLFKVLTDYYENPRRVYHVALREIGAA